MSFDLEEELKNFKFFRKYEYFDWYDYYKVEKLHKTRSKQWMSIFKKMKDAKKKGDYDALIKACETLKKHEAEDKILKKKAEVAGYYWR